MNWKDFVDQQSKQEYYKKLFSFLKEESKQYKIYPSQKNIFNAFKLCPIENIKAVILGQDPYFNPNQAHGLSFSVLPGIPKPPSLVNIFKEIKEDLNIDPPNHGCLESWANQGVLLLNSILTVRAGTQGSHRNKGWEIFTDEAIKLINSINKPIVFMLWGNFAKSKSKLLNNPKHLVLQSAHPSPLSAHNGFFGCRHFSKANQFLKNNNIEQINWKINDQ